MYDIYGNLSVVKFNVKHNPNMEKSRATIVKHKDYTTLKHNTNDTLAYEGMSIVFEDSSFYEDLTIPISSEKSSKYLSNLYSIDEKYTPVHKYFSIMIDAENVPEEFRSKALIVKINHNGNTKSLGGNFTNKVIKAKTRELGKFAVTLDTIAPTVLGKNIFNGKTFSKNQNIVFNISDDLSGIKTYHVYLNDEWVLSNYNPKRSTLTIKNDELKPFNPEEYTLKIIVFDERKNLTQKSFNITLQ